MIEMLLRPAVTTMMKLAMQNNVRILCTDHWTLSSREEFFLSRVSLVTNRVSVIFSECFRVYFVVLHLPITSIIIT